MNRIFYLLGILLTIIIGCWLYCKYCCNCCESKKCHKTEMVSPISSGLSIKSDNLNLESKHNIDFLNNGFDHLSPVNPELDGIFGQLSKYLQENKDAKSLKLTGYCLASETNTSAFPNLGFARANNVKNYLVGLGIPASSIDINGEIKDTLNLSADTLFGPIQFDVLDIDKTTPVEDFSKLKEKINANPLTLYFETGQAEIALTEQQRQQVADITRYLDKVGDASAQCIGHTDNVGDRLKNIQLGKDRAEFAKSYLIKNGIDAGKISVDSKGPDQPIADNNTAEGKAKNRRVTVTIK